MNCSTSLRTFSVFVAGALVLLASSSPSAHATFNVTLQSVSSLNTTFTYKFTPGNGTGGTFSATEYACQQTYVQTSTPQISALSSTFTTFCCQLNQNVTIGGPASFDLVSLATVPNSLPSSGFPPGSTQMGSYKASLIGELYANEYSAAQSGGANTLAAFQIAVWKIVYEDAVDMNGHEILDLSKGDFTAMSTQNVATAQSYLNSLDPTGMGAKNPDLYGLNSTTYQDQIALSSSPAIPAPGFLTPAPSSAVASISGVLMLGFISLTRRRRRSQSSLALA